MGKMEYMNIVDQTNTGDEQLVRVRVRVRRKKRKQNKRFVLLGILAAVVMLGSLLSVIGFQVYAYTARYHSDQSLAQAGIQHLKKAEALLSVYSKKVLDVRPVNEARQEFAAALPAFTRLETDIGSVPGMGTLVPVYGDRLSAAQRLMPVAIEISQAGLVTCDTLNLIVSRLHNPINGQGLSGGDLAAIGHNVRQIGDTFNRIVDLLKQVQPGQLTFDPHLAKLLDTFQKDIPILRTWLSAVENLLPVASVILGIGRPTNYLIEVLDSSELRPGGGFIGNYGIATLSGARVTGAHITDSYLLDRPFEDSGQHIPYPAAYTWFSVLAPDSWSFRDSNLDADFPVVARYAEQHFLQEGGNAHVEGVIAITPALIQHALRITGPIAVPEYHEIVTAQNLVDRIHFYQLGRSGGGNVPIVPPDGQTSQRKHFTALLAEHFLARVRQLRSSDIATFVQLLVSAIHAKDIQIYLNQSQAENLLHQFHLDGSIQQPADDGLYVVDANISVNKANSFITNTINDRVIIDVNGRVTHRTTLTYAWTTQGLYYGPPLYRDFVRVYVPNGSVLQAQDGWEQRGPTAAFGHEVWSGFFTLAYGQSSSITLVWTTTRGAKKDASGWHYSDLVQRQAGAQRTLALQVTLPSCAVVRAMTRGLVAHNEVMTLTRALSEDTNAEIDYSC